MVHRGGPLLVVAGCCADSLAAEERPSRLAWGAVLVLAAVESLAGLKTFYVPRSEESSVFRQFSEQVLAGLAAGMTVFAYAGGVTSERELARDGVTVFHEMRDVATLVAAS